MPLNSLIPVLAIPWTFPLVVSTSQKSWRSELAPSADGAREGACEACARALEAVAELAATAAAAKDEPFRNARRLDFPANWSRFSMSTFPSWAIVFPGHCSANGPAALERRAII